MQRSADNARPTDGLIKYCALIWCVARRKSAARGILNGLVPVCGAWRQKKGAVKTAPRSCGLCFFAIGSGQFFTHQLQLVHLVVTPLLSQQLLMIALLDRLTPVQNQN